MDFLCALRAFFVNFVVKNNIEWPEANARPLGEHYNLCGFLIYAIRRNSDTKPVLHIKPKRKNYIPREAKKSLNATLMIIHRIHSEIIGTVAFCTVDL